MKKIDFGTDQDFIKKYNELKTAKKMGQYYNCSSTTVLTHAKQIGYDYTKNRQFKLSEQDKQEIISAYNQCSSLELAKKYNVSRGMITKVWYDNNLVGKQILKKENYLKIDLTGQTFGFLTVKYPTKKRDATGSILWYCECNCGNPECKGFKITSATLLKTGRVVSCGSVSKENFKKGWGLSFKDLTGQKFGALTVLKRADNKIFSNGTSCVQWLCKCDCGRQTTVLASNLATGNTQSCGFCGNRFHGNLKIAEILEKNKIPFEREKRFPSCKDKNFLPFDFFVNNSYLIEYDGRQHYEQDNFFGYDTIHKHDLLKTQWCKDNHIPLIRIPYTQYEDLSLKDLILETSNFIEVK